MQIYRSKESVYIRKEFNSRRTGLEHQYGRRDVMWKHSIIHCLGRLWSHTRVNCAIWHCLSPDQGLIVFRLLNNTCEYYFCESSVYSVGPASTGINYQQSFSLTRRHSTHIQPSARHDYCLFSNFPRTWKKWNLIPGGGALGYFLGGYVPPGTPNWQPVLEKISPKIDTPF